jgi:DNA-binding beta-propeller fold protein YncE
MLWQVNVGGDNCIYELDPVAQVSTGDKICPAFEVSQRGLAYDPTTDTFYAGSWNDGLIHHFDASGTVLDSSDVGLLTSGLAFNPATRHLFVMTNSSQGLDVYVLDAQNDYAVVGGFNLNGLDPYGQAGLELDCTGHLWAVNQYTQWVIEADSGEVGVCDWKDIPWLSEASASGNVPAGGARALTLTFDATRLAVGTYQAHLRIEEDTPYRVPSIPVTLIVTPAPPAPDENKVFLPMINKN